MTKKVYNLIMVAIVLTSMLVVAAFGYYIADPKLRPVLKFQNGVDPLNIQLEKGVYRQGEMVRGYSSVCKVRKAKGATAWTLHNSKLVFFTTKEPRELPKGCFPEDGGIITFDIERVPEDAIAEEHYFTGTTTQILWGNRTVETYYRTETFLVVE